MVALFDFPVFEIKNNSTLVLIEEDIFAWELPENLEFVYHQDNSSTQ
jgi:hypothetical protein